MSEEQFKCQECGHKFRTIKAALRAQSKGCPKCNSSDIDVDTDAGEATVAEAAPRKRAWGKVAALVMQWAQDDGTNDELMEVVADMGFDESDPEEFWIGFGERLAKAFPKEPS